VISQEAHNQKMIVPRRGALNLEKTQSVHDLIFMFLSNVNSIHTMKAYKEDLKKFVNFLSKEKPGLSFVQCERMDIVSFRNWMISTPSVRGRPLSEASINRTLASLYSFFDFLIDEGVRGENPVEKIKRFKTDKRVKSSYLTDEEVCSLLAEVDQTTGAGMLHFAILTLMFSTGMRQGELRALRVSNLVRNGERISIRYKLKGGLLNVIDLNSRSEEAIGSYIAHAKCLGHSFEENDFIFRSLSAKNNGGLSAMTIARIFKMYAKKARVNKLVTPHSARVTVISRLKEKGAGIDDIAKFVGHRDIRTTDLYSKSRVSVNLSEML
jgi:integrase/recombinase XerD